MEKLSSNFYLVASIASTLLVVVLLVFAIANRAKKAKSVEKRLSELQNIFAILSLFIGIISMYIAWSSFQASIKSPDIRVNFLDGRADPWGWGREELGKLSLSYDEKGNVDLVGSMFDVWSIQLSNDGNSGTSNLKIALTFSGIWINEQPEDYTVTDHIYAHGGFQTLERNITESISPGDAYNLPDIPWHMFASEASNTLEPADMKIVVFEGSIKKFEQSYEIDLIKEEYDPEYTDEYTKKFGMNKWSMLGLQEPMSSKDDNYMFYPELMWSVYDLDWDHFKSTYPNDAYSLDIRDLYGLEFVYIQRCYFYYLQNLNAYNPVIANEARDNIAFWGRLYYRYKAEQANANYSVQDIESMITTDMLAQRY